MNMVVYQPWLLVASVSPDGE